MGKMYKYSKYQKKSKGDLMKKAGKNVLKNAFQNVLAGLTFWGMGEIVHKEEPLAIAQENANTAVVPAPANFDADEIIIMLLVIIISLIVLILFVVGGWKLVKYIGKRAVARYEQQ